jgi:transglutaminase/protease-like cytokinesis protein 3
VQLKALEDALELKLSIDAADRERARQKRERLEKKRAEEAERKRKEVQDAREKAEEDARNQLEQQEKRARIKEAKKQQLADQWRADALGNRESVFAKMRSPEFKEVALFPPPPPSLLKKNQYPVTKASL